MYNISINSFVVLHGGLELKNSYSIFSNRPRDLFLSLIGLMVFLHTTRVYENYKDVLKIPNKPIYHQYI